MPIIKCASCGKDKFIASGDTCITCRVLAPVVRPVITETVEPEPVIAIKEIKCDGCDRKLTQTEARQMVSVSGKKLLFCDRCFEIETKASNEIDSWPACAKCGKKVKQPNNDGLCFICASESTAPTKPTKMKVDLIGLGEPTDSNNYQKFFNQTVEAIKDLTVEQIREFIIKTQEDIYGLSAELARKRTAKQAAQIKFNAILEKMSLDERNALKIEDANYVPKGAGAAKKLKSPLTQIEKKKKIKGDLKNQMASLFGDKLTPEEIEERMKKLGL